MFSRFVVHPGAGHLVNAISGSGLMVPVRVDIESPSRFVGALKLLRLWVMRARERRALVRLDEHALTDIGIEVRRRGHPCGTGEIAEAVRVAADLATLRGLPAPGRRELLEAMTGVYAQGDVFGRGRVVAGAAQRVLVGSERGQLAPGTPRSGLADDLDRRLAALRLPAAATELRLEPLRGNLDADREIFLRQLLAAGIAYGKPTAGTGAGGARTVGSRWSVAVTSATHASTEAAALFGVTVPQVAAARLRHTMRRDGDRPETAALVLRRALHCALDDLAAELITAVRRRFPHEAGLAELTETIALCDETLTGQFAGALDDGIAALRESLTGLRAELVPPVIRELDGLAGARFAAKGQFRAIWAIVRAHFSFYRTAGHTLQKRRDIAAMIDRHRIGSENHAGIYPGSIIVAHYFRRIREFAKLKKV